MAGQGASTTDHKTAFASWRVAISPLSSYTIPNWLGLGTNTRTPRGGFGTRIAFSNTVYRRFSVSVAVEYDQNWWDDYWVSTPSASADCFFAVYSNAESDVNIGVSNTVASSFFGREREQVLYFVRPVAKYERFLREHLYIEVQFSPMIAWPPSFDFVSHPGWEVWPSPGFSIGLGWAE